MRILKFFFCVLAASCMLACSSDDENEEGAQTPTDKTPKYIPLNIEVTENPFTDTAAAKTGKKKAPITFLSTLNTFNLYYMYENGLSEDEGEIPYSFNGDGYGNGNAWIATHTNGKWNVGQEGQYGWPQDATHIDLGDDVPVTWYAYANGNNNSNLRGMHTGDPYVNFTADETSTAQKDFLVSKRSLTHKEYEKEYNSTIYFHFDHACSALRFNIKKADNVSTKQISVKELQLCNVKKTGRFYMNNYEWKNIEENATYALVSQDNHPMTLTGEYSTIFAGTLNENPEEAYLFMIPQDVTPWDPTSETLSSGAYLRMVLDIGGSVITGYVPFGGKFWQGYKHEVNINLGKNTLYDSDGTKIIKE